MSESTKASAPNMPEFYCQVFTALNCSLQEFAGTALLLQLQYPIGRNLFHPRDSLLHLLHAVTLVSLHPFNFPFVV